MKCRVNGRTVTDDDNLVNVLVVVGSEKIYSDMSRRFNGQKNGTDENITVIKLDSSGGNVARDEEYLRRYRQAQVREYFFGDPKNTLSPHTQQIDFGQVNIYKIADGKSSPLGIYYQN